VQFAIGFGELHCNLQTWIGIVGDGMGKSNQTSHAYAL